MPSLPNTRIAIFDSNCQLTYALATVNGSLSATGITTFSGGLNAQAAPVAMMNAPTTLGVGNYTAHTDGLLVGCIVHPADHTLLCIAWMYLGNSDGTFVWLTGGHDGFFNSNWTKWRGSNNACGMIPVRSGSNFTIQVQQSNSNETYAGTQVFWVPLGTAPGGVTVVQNTEAVDAADLLSPPPGAGLDAAVDTRDARLSALVDAIQDLFPEAPAKAKQAKLEAALHDLFRPW